MISPGPRRPIKLLHPLLRELRAAGMGDDQILVLVATGTHRDNTREEFEGTLGEEILERFRVVNHHSQDDTIMVDLGRSGTASPW